ncbi:hypothetical protein PVAND_007963 [Polypedilum vanderplanki]|uniref:Bromodomain adjacent to zinc finger domain protein 2B n=1 Tax=Polypedilum vanderplanki TaxID=319348 RepID=A0A9J6C8A7_POLVA|nr:hypothetical protein PVAND_007963 [Polypedilum vanderplanki]
MDKSDKKKQEEALKNSFMPALTNPAAFLDAASLLAHWGGGGRDAAASAMPFLPGFPGMSQQIPGFDKNSSSAAAAAMNQNWFAMAQMAAQDYFSRLQMSGMMHPELANLSALGNLAGYPNTSGSLNSSQSSASSSNKKNNSKRKDQLQDSYDAKKLSANDVLHQSKGSNFNQSFPSTSNLQKDFMAIAAAAASLGSSQDSRGTHNDAKNKGSKQNNYVPSKNSNMNHGSIRTGGSSGNSSNSRKNDIDKLNTDNNYSSKRSDLRNSDHQNYQNLFKDSNNTSLLGVRLPPDTEIIKYTSSGSKMPINNSFNQIDLDVHISPKRKKLDPYETVSEKQKNDMVEVIKLPSTFSSNGSFDQKITKDSDGGGDAPLNLSLKSSSESSKNNSKDFDLASVNNLSNLQNLTAGIGMFGNDKQQNKEGRPRNLGRGVSKPKKNTVASLLAQSRAVGIKPQQLLNSNCDLEKVRQAIMEANQQNSDVQSNTDSESYNDTTSGVSESDGENENYNMDDLKLPLLDGWKRETIIKGLTKTGGLKGDVYYYSPYNTANKLTNMQQIKEELSNNNCKFTEKNFSFSSRRIVGTFLQAAPPPYAIDGEYVKMTDYEVAQRLEEIRMYTRQPASAQLNVEQRIEIARQQQALREAKKIAKEEISKSKEKAKHLKDIEKCEKYEQQRKEKEMKNFQMQEAKRKKEEEIAKIKMEEQRRKQEEKERKRQHSTIIKQLELRRKFEEREKKRHLMLLEKLISREQKLAVRKLDAQILAELRKPKEDSEVLNKIEMPTLSRIGGLRLSGQGFADLLMSFEFLHNFGETLGFDMESLPTLQSLHNAITQENSLEAEEELLSVITHLLVCAIEDPGIPNPNRHTTLLGQTLRQADITHQNVSEILRIYLYAVATGEVRQQTGINFERERCGKFGDLHQNEKTEKDIVTNEKNTQFYEVLHDNERHKLSECLKDKPYVALNPTVKSQILAMLCNDLLLNKAVCKQIENGLESQATLKREKFLLDNKVRKYKSLIARKQRIEQYEKSQQNLKAAMTEDNNSSMTNATDKESIDEKSIKADESISAAASPAKSTTTETKPAQAKTDEIRKPIAEEEENNSEVESGDDLEEDEDANMTSDEVQKKLEKILEQCFQTKQQLHKALSSLRAKHYGQDRYWRRYWYLPKCGGIFVEGLESAQPDLLRLQTKLEDANKKKATNGTKEEDNENDTKNSVNEIKENNDLETKSDDIDFEDDEESVNKFDHIEMIKNKSVNICQTMPDVMKKNEENDDFDIEDSIPTAILVQKGNKSDDSRFVEINHVVPSIPIQKMEEEQNNEKIEPKIEPDTEVAMIKKEENDSEEKGSAIKNENGENEEKKNKDIKPPKLEPIMSKWFSLNDPEIPLLTTETDCQLIPHQVESYRNIQCKDEIIIHGHQWEIQNNLHFYNPRPYFENNDTEIVFKNESVLSTSGLDIPLIEKTLNEKSSCIKTETKSKINGFDVKKQTSPLPPVIDDLMNGKIFYEQLHSFSLPPIQNMTINNLSVFIQCENLNAPQMTPEEQELVDEVKKNGWKKPTESALVPKELRYGWYKISEIEDMNDTIKSLHVKGVREKILRQSLVSALSESIDLTTPCPVSNARAPPPANGYVEPEAFNAWNPRIAKRVEQQLLDQVEALEDKIANASMQVKGWQAPQRDNESESDILETIDLNLIRDRISNLEAAIERRYLKPPLGNNTTEAQLMNASIGNESTNNTSVANTSTNSSSSSETETISKGLSSWRDAVQRSVTSAQLSMALYTLEQCVAWDKSIMKANCQFCQSGESEDKLLLCDSCDRGYHTYCFKPKIEKIPEGDWFCFECINKVTGERKCIICGGLRPQPVGKLIYCELCPRVYHHDCYIPPMLKVPRGKWYCSNCISKAPPKKKPVRKPKELKSHNSSQSLDSSHEESSRHDVAPNSPTASMTSFSIDEHSSMNNTIPNLNSSDMTSTNANVANLNSSPTAQNTSSKGLTNNDDNETEISDSNTHSNSSPIKDKIESGGFNKEGSNTKERDDLKEKLKAEKKAAKKLVKEMAICKIILEEMEVHEDSWPFLLPVNTKQFPTYKKVIKHPMDLSTIKKRLQDMTYKARDEFVSDIRLIFDNCEIFNEDDSPVGKAGFGMRKYFELRWAELSAST